MLVSLIKFIHLIAALSLLGLTLFCFIVISSKNFVWRENQVLTRLNKIIIGLSLIGLLTGTVLVHPKHYSFHTAWIKAAYLFLFIFMAGIFSLTLLKEKRLSKLTWKAVYFLAFIILLCITHDAVLKSTFIFKP